MKAVAERDLATVQRHISRDQWPVDAGDPRALDAYFRWLRHAYPSEARVMASLVTPSAARLDIEGKKDGRRVKGPVNLRRVDDTWKITDAPLTCRMALGRRALRRPGAARAWPGRPGSPPARPARP
jgi:hypothetical protein